MKKILFLYFLSLVVNAENNQGKNIFNQLKPLMLRVKAADSLTSPKASYGSGFVVHKSGIIATNYHVISDFVMQPGEQWKIVAELENNKNIEAHLIAFSVADDLALIKIDKEFPSQVVLENATPSKGDRVFSLGLPHDINMSLIEGVYNGLLESGPYQIVHVSTPLNEGMSGGPSVNEFGKVVGINDARILFSNNISFIVPSAKLNLLLKEINPLKLKFLSKQEAQKTLYAQLYKTQNLLVDSMFKAKIQKVEMWKGRSINVPDYLKCWSEGKDEPQLPYVLKHRICRLDHAQFVTDEFDAGSYSMDAKILDASKINRFSVDKLWGDQGNLIDFLRSRTAKDFFGQLDAREILSSYECKRGFLKASFWGELKDLRTGLCVRKYKKAENLYDFTFQWSDFTGPLKVRVNVEHTTVSMENIKKLMAYWTERFE
jgi:serine protease Do